MSRPATSSRLRRYVSAAASLLLFVLLASACSSDGFPVGYDDQVDTETGLSNVEQNWLEGCEVGLAQSELAEDANNVCACSFQAISADGGLPFDEFVQLDGDLKSNPESLNTGEPNSVENQLLDIVKGCIAGS